MYHHSTMSNSYAPDSHNGSPRIADRKEAEAKAKEEEEKEAKEEQEAKDRVVVRRDCPVVTIQHHCGHHYPRAFWHQ